MFKIITVLVTLSLFAGLSDSNVVKRESQVVTSRVLIPRSTTTQKPTIDNVELVKFPRIEGIKANETVTRMIRRLNQLIITFEKQYNAQLIEISKYVQNLNKEGVKLTSNIQQRIETFSSSLKTSAVKFSDFVKSLRDISSTRSSTSAP